MVTKKTAPKRRKAFKKITVAEFHAWLEGVEELQPDGWSPDKQQWDLIRAKIAKIIDQPAPQPQLQPRIQPQMNPNVLPGLPPAPPSPGGVPMGAVIEPDAAAANLLKPSSPDVPKKTPNLEGGGPYATSFA